ncbi:MAG: iron-containing alcohol dehydrogenase [Thermovirga sp.]|nr:iron-containing alcohol dehydrogenase [Thermovirga sp.]
MWDDVFPIDQVQEIRAKTTVYLGVGAIKKISDIAENLKKKGVNNVLVVTGRSSYKKTGAWDHVERALKEQGLGYVIYDKVTPNPTADSVDEATKMGRDFGANAVIAIGGGSPIDAAKSVAILLEYKDKTARDLYELSFAPQKAVPLVAINLTHGTGTEVDRFAVVTIPEKEYKPAIAYDCIYPMYSIDDPKLMTGLSLEQTRYVSIDALNHVIEACTTKTANPFSILLAKETVRLIAKYLPRAVENPQDLRARYFLLYASMIAGVSFDNGLLHFTHALEHPLSAIKPELAHGLGLAMIVPAVVEAIYPVSKDILDEVLEPITKGAKEAEEVARALEKWIFSVGVTSKLEDEGFKGEDIPKLVKLVRETPSLDGLVSLAPVEGTDEVIKRIYERSLKPIA